jgi:dethiobiotin synthetase
VAAVYETVFLLTGCKNVTATALHTSAGKTPGSKALLDAEVREGGKVKPIKPIHTNDATKKRYIKLFETLGTKLHRIIVGPSRDQSGNYERARAILGNRPKIVLSQTPFIG